MRHQPLRSSARPDSTVFLPVLTRFLLLNQTTVWDSAGQECFRSITRSYFRGAQAALLVFSLTDRASFAATKTWLEDLREYGEEDLVILLVGNKEVSGFALGALRTRGARVRG